MGLMQDLSDRVLAARRARDPQSAFYALVMSEITERAKVDGGRQPNDADADAVIRGQIKQLDKLLNGDPGKGIAPLPESPYRDSTQAKRDALGEFVPVPLEGQELADAIRVAAVEAQVPLDVKSMGAIMGVLKARYPSQIDGAAVSTLLRGGL